MKIPRKLRMRMGRLLLIYSEKTDLGSYERIVCACLLEVMFAAPCDELKVLAVCSPYPFLTEDLAYAGFLRLKRDVYEVTDKGKQFIQQLGDSNE